MRKLSARRAALAVIAFGVALYGVAWILFVAAGTVARMIDAGGSGPC